MGSCCAESRVGSRQRSKMTVIRHRRKWAIEGSHKERGRVAQASVEGNRIVYRLQSVFAGFYLWDCLRALYDAALSAVDLVSAM